MSKFHVEARELVYVTRVYEVDAPDAKTAALLARGGSGEVVKCIEVGVGPNYRFCAVTGVWNMAGDRVE